MIRNNLNSICPYFAMYPLDYPLDAIQKSGAEYILDPFCGRGTTNVAARMNGLYSVGVDSSRVAYAISSAKMVDTTSEAIVGACNSILDERRDPQIPCGEFWEMMYDPGTLKDICILRESLLEECDTPERIALRGILLGALHGPMRKGGRTSYLSNQFPRTYASKPAYSVRFWKSRGMLTPPKVDVKDLVNIRAHRYYSGDMQPTKGFIIDGDSTEHSTFRRIREGIGEHTMFDTVITSPPYHGMNTYIPDQWLRNWFVGGPDSVEYTTKRQTSGSLSVFIDQLSQVWNNCSMLCSDGARMYVRFGEIGSKVMDPEEVIRKTFDGTCWKIDTIDGAGEPKKGHRSSTSFIKGELRDYKEIDVKAIMSDQSFS